MLKLKILVLIFIGSTLINFISAKNSIYYTEYIVSNSVAQVNNSKQGKITGKIIDNDVNSPLEFVTVAIFDANKNLIGGGISDFNGKFKIENIPVDISVYARFSFIGYQDYISDAFVIDNANNTKNLNIIKLKSSAQTLGAVNVTAQKRMIEYSLDKKIVNVEQSLVSDGGTAADVLENVPSITVDEEGNVSMKGSDNVSILIDGKPAVLSGMGIDQIAASNIENIEIISNPSAKYNPEGMSGIINIITKKRSNNDFNGIVNLSGSSSNRYNFSTNLSAGLGKVTLFTNIDASYRIHGGDGESKTIKEQGNSFFPNDNMELEYNENSRRSYNYGGQVRFGADYRINKKNTLSANVGFGSWWRDYKEQSPNISRHSYLDTTSDNSYIPTDDNFNWLDSSSNYSTRNSLFQQISSMLSYKLEFDKPGQELTIDAAFNYSMPDANTFTERTFHSRDSDIVNDIQSSSSEGERIDFDGQINYVHPFTDKMKLEVGYQGIVRSNKSFEHQSLRVFPLQDTALNFDYVEHNHGIYANYIAEFNKFSMQVGGRMEFANMNASTSSELQDTTFSYFYPRFYPSIHLAYKIGKMQEIQLSYTRRVNRPRPWYLNPFINYNNFPYSIRFGNPALKPEDIHSVELNYSLFYKGTSIYATVYYRHINDFIRRYTYNNETGDNTDELDNVLMNTYINYESGTNYGIDITYDQRLFSWWRFSLSGSLYQNITKGGVDAEFNTEGLSYNAKFNTTFSLPLNFTIQLACQYRGPRYSGQTEYHGFFYADLAVRKSFFKNKFNVGLRFSDMFNTRLYSNTTIGDGFVTTFERKPYRSQAIFVTLSYKINQGIKPGSRKHGGGDDDMGEGDM